MLEIEASKHPGFNLKSCQRHRNGLSVYRLVLPCPSKTKQRLNSQHKVQKSELVWRNGHSKFGGTFYLKNEKATGDWTFFTQYGFYIWGQLKNILVLEIEAFKPPRNALKVVNVIEKTPLYTAMGPFHSLRPKNTAKLTTQCAEKWICIWKWAFDILVELFLKAKRPQGTGPFLLSVYAT